MKAKIFACAEFGTCTIPKTSDQSLHACAGCQRYATKLPTFVPGAIGADFFDSVPVISLERTPERFTAFQGRFPADWPFVPPLRFPAVDGTLLDVGTFTEGGPALGCLRSHLAVLGCKWTGPVLVLEDDCEFVDGAGERLKGLLAKVPPGADLFYVGCQLRDPVQEISPGMVKAIGGAQRTHAYVAYPRFYRRAAALLADCKVHIDWKLEELAKAGKINCYAASPVLAIQSGGWSTIRYKQVGSESWDNAVPVARRDAATVPVVLLKASQIVVDSLRDRGLIHTGYWRNSAGIDSGLASLMTKPIERRPRLLRVLVNLLRSEAAAFHKAACALWHPDLTLDMLADLDAVEMSGDDFHD